jgi:hypothetical protein
MAEDIPLWVRRAVHARDQGKCRWCGRTNAGIHLHHVIYRSNGGKHLLENLIALCGEHHALVHSDKPFYQPLLLELLEHEPSVIGYQLVRWKAKMEQQRLAQPLHEPTATVIDTDGRPDHGRVGRLIQLD